MGLFDDISDAAGDAADAVGDAAEDAADAVTGGGDDDTDTGGSTGGTPGFGGQTGSDVANDDNPESTGGTPGFGGQVGGGGDSGGGSDSDSGGSTGGTPGFGGQVGGGSDSGGGGGGDSGGGGGSSGGGDSPTKNKDGSGSGGGSGGSDGGGTPTVEEAIEARGTTTAATQEARDLPEPEAEQGIETESEQARQLEQEAQRTLEERLGTGIGAEDVRVTETQRDGERVLEAELTQRGRREVLETSQQRERRARRAAIGAQEGVNQFRDSRQTVTDQNVAATEGDDIISQAVAGAEDIAGRDVPFVDGSLAEEGRERQRTEGGEAFGGVGVVEGGLRDAAGAIQERVITPGSETAGDVAEFGTEFRARTRPGSNLARVRQAERVIGQLQEGESLQEAGRTALFTAPDINTASARNVLRGEQAETDQSDTLERFSEGAARGAGSIGNIPGLAVGAIELGETAAAGTAAAGRSVVQGSTEPAEQFTGRAAGAGAVMAAETVGTAAENPAEFAGAAVGSTVASAGAIGGAGAVGRATGFGGARASRAAATAIQPGEEAVIFAARRGVPGARGAARLVGDNVDIDRRRGQSFFESDRGQLELLGRSGRGDGDADGGGLTAELQESLQRAARANRAREAERRGRQQARENVEAEDPPDPRTVSSDGPGGEFTASQGPEVRTASGPARSPGAGPTAAQQRAFAQSRRSDVEQTFESRKAQQDLREVEEARRQPEQDLRERAQRAEVTQSAPRPPGGGLLRALRTEAETGTVTDALARQEDAESAQATRPAALTGLGERGVTVPDDDTLLGAVPAAALRGDVFAQARVDTRPESRQETRQETREETRQETRQELVSRQETRQETRREPFLRTESRRETEVPDDIELGDGDSGAPGGSIFGEAAEIRNRFLNPLTGGDI